MLTSEFPIRLVTCEVWDYTKPDVTNIQQSMFTFNWTKAFENISVSSKINVLNKN